MPAWVEALRAAPSLSVVVGVRQVGHAARLPEVVVQRVAHLYCCQFAIFVGLHVAGGGEGGDGRAVGCFQRVRLCGGLQQCHAVEGVGGVGLYAQQVSRVAHRHLDSTLAFYRGHGVGGGPCVAVVGAALYLGVSEHVGCVLVGRPLHVGVYGALGPVGVVGVRVAVQRGGLQRALRAGHGQWVVARLGCPQAVFHHNLILVLGVSRQSEARRCAFGMYAHGEGVAALHPLALRRRHSGGLAPCLAAVAAHLGHNPVDYLRVDALHAPRHCLRGVAVGHGGVGAGGGYGHSCRQVEHRGAEPCVAGPVEVVVCLLVVELDEVEVLRAVGHVSQRRPSRRGNQVVVQRVGVQVVVVVQLAPVAVDGPVCVPVLARSVVARPYLASVVGHAEQRHADVSAPHAHRHRHAACVVDDAAGVGYVGACGLLRHVAVVVDQEPVVVVGVGRGAVAHAVLVDWQHHIDASRQLVGRLGARPCLAAVVAALYHDAVHRRLAQSGHVPCDGLL